MTKLRLPATPSTSRAALITALFFGLAPVYGAYASCFDRTIAISRYTFLDPTNINEIYQDIFKIDLSVAGSASVVRLTAGAMAATPYDNIDFTWSPDGNKIVFVSTRNGTPELHAMDAVDANGDNEGDNLISLGVADLELGSPHWITGGKLAFIKGDVDGNGQVHTADISAVPALSNISAVTMGGNYKLGSRYTADGQLIGYAEEYVLAGIGRFYALGVLRLSDSLEVLLSDPGVIERDLDWTPGSSEVVFGSDRANPGADLDLYSAEVDLTAAPHLKNVQPITSTPSTTETHPRVSPDGQCLAYIANDGTVPYGPNDDLRIRDLQTSEDRRITSSRDISGFAWRP